MRYLTWLQPSGGKQYKNELNRCMQLFSAFMLLVSSAAGLAGAVPTTAYADVEYAAEYWDLGLPQSSPEIPETTPDYTSLDSAIDFDWGAGSPDASIDEDGFVARWTSSIAYASDNYYFTVKADDGVRVRVDGVLVIDAWTDQTATLPHTVLVPLTAGNHIIVVEYYENDNDAEIRFSYGLTPGAAALVGQDVYSTSEADNASPNPKAFDRPRAVLVDPTQHLLFVADTGNNRVLVFELDPNNQLLDTTADFVLGQPNFFSSTCNQDQPGPSASTLCQPAHLVLDSYNNLLFVADTGNNRILIYDLAEINSGEAAIKVLGQPDFISFACCDTTSSQLTGVMGLAIDETNFRLFVADSSSRLVVFDINSIDDGEAAVNVLGQSTMTSADLHCHNENRATASGFCLSPAGIAHDQSSRLFVSDPGNHRILVFDTTTIDNNEAAVNVLGQTSFTTGAAVTSDTQLLNPRGLTFDDSHQQLYVADPGTNGADRVLVFDVSAVVDGQAALHVFGQSDFTSSGCNQATVASATTLCEAADVIHDQTSQLLYVADTGNNRVLVFDTSTTVDSQAAAAVIGQTSFANVTQNGVTHPNATGFDTPQATAIDDVNHRLFVADQANNRVLMFRQTFQEQIEDAVADAVIGAPDYVTDACVLSSSRLCAVSGLAYDGANERLFVSDKANNRVLVFDVNHSTLTNNPEALYVLGQPDFLSSSCSGEVSLTSSQTLCEPAQLAYDKSTGYLFVADSGYSRVVAYNVAPNTIATSMEASFVIGQSDFTRSDCQIGGDVATDTLCAPKGVAINSVTHQLFVSDGMSNSRVLVYNGNPANMQTGDDALYVLGQPDFTSAGCNRDSNPSLASFTTLCEPAGLAVDETLNQLYVSDSGNSRIIAYDISPGQLGNGVSGIHSFGQVSENDSSCNWGGSTNQYSLCSPQGVTVDQATNTLFIADTANHRVVQYEAVATPPANASDIDNDGIPNSVEQAAPNNGDSNNDGVSDVAQLNVTSIVNPVSSQYTTLEAPQNCTNNTVSIAPEGINANEDTGFDYPSGLMNFTLDCGSPGQTATIVIYLYGSTASGQSVRKFNPTNSSYATITGATVTEVTINGQSALRVSYAITDGGPLDQDGVDNGVIVDPVGIAKTVTPPPPVKPPTIKAAVKSFVSAVTTCKKNCAPVVVTAAKTLVNNILTIIQTKLKTK